MHHADRLRYGTVCAPLTLSLDGAAKFNAQPTARLARGTVRRCACRWVRGGCIRGGRWSLRVSSMEGEPQPAQPEQERNEPSHAARQPPPGPARLRQLPPADPASFLTGATAGNAAMALAGGALGSWAGEALGRVALDGAGLAGWLVCWLAPPPTGLTPLACPLCSHRAGCVGPAAAPGTQPGGGAGLHGAAAGHLRVRRGGGGPRRRLWAAAGRLPAVAHPLAAAPARLGPVPAGAGGRARRGDAVPRVSADCHHRRHPGRRARAGPRCCCGGGRGSQQPRVWGAARPHPRVLPVCNHGERAFR